MKDIQALEGLLAAKMPWTHRMIVFLSAKLTVPEEIPGIHLAKNRQDPKAFDLARLAAASAGFSGAEIEQAIVAALYEVHAEKRPPDTSAVEKEMKRTRPLSVVMAEKVAALRAWASARAVPAD